MCENVSPVKSLTFLQKDVASVVDHQNKPEEEQFRALLTHLLSPSSQKHQDPPILSSLLHSRSPIESTLISRSALESEDTREGSTRPRKHSQSDSEAKSNSSSSGEEDGRWTSDLPLCASSAESPFSDGASGTRTDQNIPNPREEEQLSGDRYRQRTEVFESLLKFVVDGEKQPDDDLLDLVESDKGFRLL
jgi:hypothetical protein